MNLFQKKLNKCYRVILILQTNQKIFKKEEINQDSNSQVQEIPYNKILKMLQVNSFKIVLPGQVKLSKKSQFFRKLKIFKMNLKIIHNNKNFLLNKLRIFKNNYMILIKDWKNQKIQILIIKMLKIILIKIQNLSLINLNLKVIYSI